MLKPGGCKMAIGFHVMLVLLVVPVALGLSEVYPAWAAVAEAAARASRPPLKGRRARVAPYLPRNYTPGSSVQLRRRGFVRFAEPGSGTAVRGGIICANASCVFTYFAAFEVATSSPRAGLDPRPRISS